MPVAAPPVPDSQGPLRRDVRLLGALLGHVIREQEGQALYDAEERVRQTSRAGDFATVQTIVAGLPLDRYYEGMENRVLVAVTETASRESIDRLADALAEEGGRR